MESHAQILAPGRSLRSVSNASATESIAQAGTASSSSSIVLTRSSPTRGRKMRAVAVSQPI
jgi:hypothetical protein